VSTAFRYFFAASEQGYDLAHGKSRQGRCNGDTVVVVDDDHYSDDDEDDDGSDDDGSDDDDDDDHDDDEEKKEDDDASYYHQQQQSIDSSHCFQVGRGSASRRVRGYQGRVPGSRLLLEGSGQ